MPAHKILPYCHWCGAKITQTINHKPYLCSKKLNRFNLAEELRTLLNADPPAYNTSTVLYYVIRIIQWIGISSPTHVPCLSAFEVGAFTAPVWYRVCY